MDFTATSERRPLLNCVRDRPSNCNSSSNAVTLEDSATGGGKISPGGSERGGYRRWPWIVWFMLKIIGLYSYRQVATGRRCHACRLAVLQRRQRDRGEEGSGCGLYPGAWDDQGGDGDGDEDGGDDVSSPTNENVVPSYDGNMNSTYILKTEEPACLVCQSEWWDSSGRYQPYSDADIGIRKWNHYGSAVLSVVWPVTLIAFTMYDFFFYLRNYWGQQKQLIHLISYSTYLFVNMSIPLLTLIANIHNMVVDRRGAKRRRASSWYECLGTRYIVKRLQHLELGVRGLPRKPFLGVCLLWPVFNGAYKVVIYYVFVSAEMDVHVQISLVSGMVSMIVWGNFCYLMLLIRLSFQKQVQLELAFLWRHAGRVDTCRRRLALFAEDLGSMCRLASFWIVIVVAVSTWAFTTQICWEYLIISNDIQFRNAVLEVNIHAMIWSENTMFLVLPLMAVGDMNLNGMWVQYQQGISRMRCEENEAFWDKMVAFCKEQSPEYIVQTVTLVFSALGLFLGLHFGDQNVDYWTIRTANATTLNPALMMEH